MLVDEKPPLDEELLVHFGVPGMRWGHRKPEPTKGVGSGNYPHKGGGGSGHHGMSAQTKHRLKTAGKVGLAVAGVAAGAYLLSKTGNRPHASTLTSRSNRAGARAVVGVLKRSGKVSVKAVKFSPKAAKVGGKAAYKTTKFVGKMGFKGGKAVTVNTSRSVSNAVKKIKFGGGTKQPVAGERFGKLLLGEYGPKSLRPSSTANAIIMPRHRRR